MKNFAISTMSLFALSLIFVSCGDGDNSENIASAFDKEACEKEDNTFWDGSKCHNPCKDNPCGHGICKTKGIDTYDCICDDGYDVNSKNKCVDIDECSDPKLNNCSGNTECANEEGTYSCICKENYTGENCVPKTRTKDCSGGLPKNAKWNDNGGDGTFTQTWDGEKWSPVERDAVFSPTPGVCAFVCKTGFYWDENKCEAMPTQTADCEGLPENAHWNSVSNITQTWNGEEWLPQTTGTYNTTASTTECRFTCNTNYSWKSNACEADSRTVKCEGLPENADWNKVSSITQTWDGEDWQPSLIAVYEETESTKECRFKCKKNYTWNDSECVADTKNSACTGLPANAQWNSVSSISQTWNGSSWVPSSTGTYNTTASTSECRFNCVPDYHWENSSCISDTKSNVICTGLPANAQWNSVSNISQTWNGSSWVPSSTGTYNTTASTSECRFKCNTNYTWNGSICKANSRIENCTGLPANAKWNSASSITQIWNGSDWEPSTTGSYSQTASTTECKYTCKPNFFYDYVSACVNPCNEEACEEIANSTGKCIGMDWDTFSCECEKMYKWNGIKCVALPECSIDDITPCKDAETSLTWSAKSSNRMALYEATAYCSNLEEGGYTNWRLPNIDELRSIIIGCSNTATYGECRVSFEDSCLSFLDCFLDFCEGETCYSVCVGCDSTGAVTISKFGDAEMLWSSSVRSDDPDYNWVVDFSTGELDAYTNYYFDDEDYIYVRCVR